jgi:hypothetical protein
MNRKPKILVRGDDPNCIHVEFIQGYIGTCRLCGQVRDYSVCQDERDERMVLKGRKGGRAYAAIYGH